MSLVTRQGGRDRAVFLLIGGDDLLPAEGRVCLLKYHILRSELFGAIGTAPGRIAQRKQHDRVSLVRQLQQIGQTLSVTENISHHAGTQTGKIRSCLHELAGTHNVRKGDQVLEKGLLCHEGRMLCLRIDVQPVPIKNKQQIDGCSADKALTA